MPSAAEVSPCCDALYRRSCPAGRACGDDIPVAPQPSTADTAAGLVQRGTVQAGPEVASAGGGARVAVRDRAHEATTQSGTSLSFERLHESAERRASGGRLAAPRRSMSGTSFERRGPRDTASWRSLREHLVYSGFFVARSGRLMNLRGTLSGCADVQFLRRRSRAKRRAGRNAALKRRGRLQAAQHHALAQPLGRRLADRRDPLAHPARRGQGASLAMAVLQRPGGLLAQRHRGGERGEAHARTGARPPRWRHRPAPARRPRRSAPARPSATRPSGPPRAPPGARVSARPRAPARRRARPRAARRG